MKKVDFYFCQDCSRFYIFDKRNKIAKVNPKQGIHCKCGNVMYKAKKESIYGLLCNKM